MKKRVFLVILSLVLLSSCSLDDNSSGAEFSFEFMPIESVVMPDEFVHGETYAIGVSYIKPNSCYEFNDFAYDINGGEFTVAVVNTVYENATCSGNPTLNTVSFDFTVTSTEAYTFRFFQGENETGIDEYHTVEVPVLDSRSVSGGTEN